MGNSASSEALRKAPQKLSKPNPLNSLPAADLLSPSDLSASSSTRYSNNYRAASWAAASVEELASPVQHLLIEYDGNASSSTTEAWPRSRRHSRIVDTGDIPALYESGIGSKRSSMASPGFQTGNRLSRSSSMTVGGRGEVQPIIRAQRFVRGRRCCPTPQRESL